MDIKKTWREGYKQLKKIVNKLVKPAKEKSLQPALQPYHNKPRY